MRLKADEKEKYIQEVLSAETAKKNSKVVPLKDPKVESAWNALCWDHFSKLRLQLQHISNYQILDMLAHDAGKNHITTKQFVYHYDDDLFLMLCHQLKSAYEGLDFLYSIVSDEAHRRHI